jgi:hypothetical protein
MTLTEYYEKRKLLTDGKSNTKTAKNSIPSYYLSLQPTDLNSAGLNLCKFSTKECRAACLQYAGRQGFTNVVLSRQRKTDYFVENKREFLHKLWYELRGLNLQYTIQKKVAVRLNLLSDVNWEEEFGNHQFPSLGSFSHIQFYDYTKDPFKVDANKLSNYHFTYSYSGGNWKWCEKFLKEKKANVEVVFKNSVPSTYNNFQVINGDLSDERFKDPKGVIVGLKYKTPKGLAYQPNKFVVDI